MNRTVSVTLAALLAAACSDTPVVTLPVVEVRPDLGVVANGGRRAVAPLSGDQEVPARETGARGNAVFRLSADGTALHYQLIVANIENVVQAHIHIGMAGANGSVGAFLYGLVASGGGPVDGVLAQGTLTAADFVGPLAGLSMDDLIDEFQAGNAYVNVHTNDGIGSPNTGPGDFAAGEVRGQVQ